MDEILATVIVITVIAGATIVLTPVARGRWRVGSTVGLAERNNVWRTSKRSLPICKTTTSV